MKKYVEFEKKFQEKLEKLCSMSLLDERHQETLETLVEMLRKKRRDFPNLATATPAKIGICYEETRCRDGPPRRDGLPLDHRPLINVRREHK